MPKVKRTESTALKKVRSIFRKTEPLSDSEESFTSDSSNEFLQHIPVNTEVLVIETLSLEEPRMEDFALKINRIGEMLEALTEKSKEHDELLKQLNTTPNIQPETPAVSHQIRLEDFFRIPDPIKSIPHYDGNRRQLAAWLTTAENTLSIFKVRVSDELFQIYQTAVINKIDGRAKDIICLAGNPQDFETVKNILTTALGDRQELSTYKCQLWRNKMIDGVSIHKYYQKSKEILQNIKTIAKQNQNYRDNWAVINSFIEEDGLAAFIAGLHPQYFGHVQAARPKDIEDAYAFLCKFRSQEITAETTRSKPNHREPNKEKPTFKQNYQNNQPTNKTHYKDVDNTFQNKQKSENTAEPMEIGSTKSKLTLNKRVIHNNEISEAPIYEENLESDTESDPEIDANFLLTTGKLQIT